MRQIGLLLLLAVLLTGCFGGTSGLQRQPSPAPPGEWATAKITIRWNELDNPAALLAAGASTAAAAATLSSASALNMDYTALPVTHVGVRFEYDDRSAVYTESVARADSDESTLTLLVAPGKARLFLAAVHYDETTRRTAYGAHYALWFGRLDDIQITPGAVIELSLDQITARGQLIRPEWRPQPGPIAAAFEQGTFRPADYPHLVWTDRAGEVWFFFPIEIRDIFGDAAKTAYGASLVGISGYSSNPQPASEPGWVRFDVGCSVYPAESCKAPKGGLYSVPMLHEEKFNLPADVLFAIPPLMPDIEVDWSGWSE